MNTTAQLRAFEEGWLDKLRTSSREECAEEPHYSDGRRKKRYRGNERGGEEGARKRNRKRERRIRRVAAQAALSITWPTLIFLFFCSRFLLFVSFLLFLLFFLFFLSPVADCVSLFSLDKLDVVPIDTHIFALAQRHMPALKGKSLTPALYDQIGKFFVQRYTNGDVERGRWRGKGDGREGAEAGGVGEEHEYLFTDLFLSCSSPLFLTPSPSFFLSCFLSSLSDSEH